MYNIYISKVNKIQRRSRNLWPNRISCVNEAAMRSPCINSFMCVCACVNASFIRCDKTQPAFVQIDDVKSLNWKKFHFLSLRFFYLFFMSTGTKRCFIVKIMMMINKYMNVLGIITAMIMIMAMMTFLIRAHKPKHKYRAAKW